MVQIRPAGPSGRAEHALSSLSLYLLLEIVFAPPSWRAFSSVSGPLSVKPTTGSSSTVIIPASFPSRLEGVWSKFKGYLARLSLIMAVSRTGDDTYSIEQTEEDYVSRAVLLLEYFKTHALRIYTDLSEADPLDLLAHDITLFLPRGPQKRRRHRNMARHPHSPLRPAPPTQRQRPTHYPSSTEPPSTRSSRKNHQLQCYKRQEEPPAIHGDISTKLLSYCPY